VAHFWLEITAAVYLRREIENEWLLGIGGALSIVFGVLHFLFPGPGALSLVWLIAIYSIMFGVVMIILDFRLRGTAARQPAPGEAATPTQ
jgi:uncharacterized membrane protein HdeD (DUF308 family)